METYIKGNFRKSIYQNESGYTIGIFKIKETNDEELDIYVGRTITFTGYFHELNDMDTYLFYGNLVNHERYGEQFNVTGYERCKPEEKDAIVEFLTSGIFKGIGEKKAKKIVEVLGKDTLNIILENPDNLLLIPTITKKNADLLHEKLVEYEASYQTILKLTDLGFHTKDSLVIYNHYKDKTMKVIDDNIYKLMEDILDMTFKKIDIIALKMGILPNDTRRVQVGILYTITELSNTTGHCYFFLDELQTITRRVLNSVITVEEFDTSLETLQLDGKIIKIEDKYYLRTLYDAESNIVNRFLSLTMQKENNNAYLEEDILELEKFYDIKYNKDQKNAIMNGYIKPFLIVTGGPGTGKTTIIKGITELYRLKNKYSYEELREKIALLAPTGRASKRMSEATLLPAQTIHRFLKWNKETNKFAVNEYNKSDVEFVIVDESSMIDVGLLENLLKGLSSKTKIILVGDDHQLPSVGPGQVLRDLIESEVLPVCFLKELYRQSEDSHILSLAYHIQDGIVSQDDFNKEDDLTFISCTGNEVKDKLKEVCSAYLDMDDKNFQVLAPMYKTQNGIDELNQVMQEIFNPKKSNKKELQVGDVIYREHDKVIQLTNMPEDNVFNGDIGIIEKIETGSKKEIYIDFDGNKVKYTPANFNKFKHGFAISIHKSQGSEFNVVIIPLVKNFKKMLYQRLIYTGVTRAKKKLYLIGEIDALNMAVKNQNNDLRRTTIKNMLQDRIK